MIEYQPNALVPQPAQRGDEAPTSGTPADRTQVKTVKFYEHFTEENKKLFNEQQSLWGPIYENALKSAAYAMGRQALMKSPGGFGFKVYKFKGSEQDLHVYNEFAALNDELTSQWVNLNPKIQFALLHEDEQRAAEAKDEFQAFADHLANELLTEDNKIRLALNAQLGGQYCAELWFDEQPEDGGASEMFDPVEQAEIPGLTTAECLDCQISFEPEPGMGTACPNPYCGSANTLIDEQEAQPVQYEGEPQERQTGKICAQVHDVWSYRFNLNGRAEKSDWFYVEEELPRSTVEAKHGQLNGGAVGISQASDEVFHGARVMRRLERTHMQNHAHSHVWQGSAETDDDNSVIVQRFFYAPERLMFLKLGEPVTVKDEYGQDFEIPADVPLHQVFTKGLCIKTALNADRFFSVSNVDHRKRFVHGMYSVLLGKNHGRGIEDARVAQFQRNKLRSPMFDYWVRTLQPSIVIDKRVFGNDTQLFNRPKGVIEANSAMLDGQPVSNFFAPVIPPPIDQAALLFDQVLGATMQRATKRDSSQSDVAGNDNTTATAVRDGAARRAEAPSLHYALYAGFQKELYLRAFELAGEHHQDMLIIAVSEKLGGERKRKLFDTELLRAGVIMGWVMARSYMPDLDSEKRAKYIEMLTAAQMLAQLGMLNERTMKHLEEKFGAEFDGGEGESNESCEEALDLMHEAFEQAQGLAMPEELYALAPVDPYELDHDKAILWWRKYLTSNRGRKEAPAVRDAIHFHIDQRVMALQQEAMLQGALSAAPQVGQMSAMPMLPEANADQSKGKDGKSKDSGGGSPAGIPNNQPAPQAPAGF